MSLLVLLKLVDIWATLEAGVGFKLCWSAHAVVPGCLLWSGFGLWGQVAWQQVTRRYLKASCVLQENERTKDMIIEQRFHRAIIGQKGEKIKEIRDKFPEASFFYFIFIFLHLHLKVVVHVCGDGLKSWHILCRSSLIFLTLHIRVMLYSCEGPGLKWRNAQNLCRRWWQKW